jgi:hypothetical protein
MGKAGTLGFLVKRVPIGPRKAREKIAQALPFAQPVRVLLFLQVVKIGNSHGAVNLAKEVPTPVNCGFRQRRAGFSEDKGKRRVRRESRELRCGRALAHP